jgi:hypothetical protein
MFSFTVALGLLDSPEEGLAVKTRNLELDGGPYD